jgi:hypothetical protein
MGQEWTDLGLSAWLALTFIEVPLGSDVLLQTPSSLLVSLSWWWGGVFIDGLGAFWSVINISTAGSMYWTGKVGEVFLLEKYVIVFLQALYYPLIIFVLKDFPSSFIK